MIKDVGLLGLKKNNENKGDVELTLSQSETDKHMTAIAT